jgi:predicted 3-demethylubiquinone-9 3-methyltransferase (glyoxalase superfamily)
VQKITPNLWFDNEAEEAAKFYTSVFKDGRILETVRYPEAATEVSGKPAGSVLTVEFEILGQRFIALNGGADFKFSEAVSFAIPCKDQAEVDYYWDALIAGGGEESYCGWLKDRFGLSWQVTPTALNEMMSSSDEAKVNAMTAAMLQMRKLDLATLETAFNEA